MIVFIITLDIIKLQKYFYTLNTPYHGGFASLLTKRICMKEQRNEPHAITVSRDRTKKWEKMKRCGRENKKS